MALESGSTVDLTYIPEVTRGTTPASPQMIIQRAIGRNVNPSKNLLRSAEVRADRLQAKGRHGFRSATGSVGFELANRTQDDWLEMVLAGTWTAAVTTGTATIAATAPATYTRTGGSFVTDGFEPGDVVTVTGFTDAADNGDRTLLTVAATTVTVSTTRPLGTAAVPLVTEAATGNEVIAQVGKKLKAGSVMRTMTLERRFKTTLKYQPFTGVAINQISLNWSPENIVGGSYDLIAMNFSALTGTSLDTTPTAAATDDPFNGFDGYIYEGGATIGVVTAFSITVNNNRSLLPVLFSTGSSDVFEGIGTVTGSLTCGFQDETLLNKFVNETNTSADILMKNPDGVGWMRIRIPLINYTGATIDPPQQGAVLQVMPFEGAPDPVSLTNIVIQRSNV